MKNILKHLLPSKEAVFNQEAIMEELPIIAKHLYPKEVMEIHHEFETAADKLLEEAKSIIQEAATKDVDKVSRLEKLGFKQVNQVTQLKPLLQKAELSKEQIELLKYYRQEYPFNKFITEEQVKIICHKYNLVCGDVSRFTGFVPEKNLREIERFKLKEREANILLCKETRGEKRTFILENAEIGTNFHSPSFEHIYIKEQERSRYAKAAFQRAVGDEVFYANDDNNLFNIGFRPENFIIESNSLKICAPVKDMDISGLELTDGYKLEKKHIPDPVVLQLVKGGYLILTAWGDEASDPFVVNEINN